MVNKLDRSGPLVSVIIPSYNAELTLREAIGSALQQSYGPIEIIVVDDGSTDQTAAIAEEFVSRDVRVQLQRRENGGVSAALGAGFAVARGEYVARLDSDDIWHPAKLEQQMKVAAADPAAGFIYCFVRYIDADGRVVQDAPPQQFPRRALCRGYYESIVGGNSSAIMRRKAVVDAGGCEATYESWEDLILQLRITESHPVAFVPEYLVGYRVRGSSLSADPQNMLKSWRRAREELKLLFPNVPRFVHDWAHSLRILHLAESFAWRRSYSVSASLLAEAFQHDPARTWAVLRYRLARSVKGRRGRRRAHETAPLFLDCNPRERVLLNDYGLGSEGKQLRQLEAGRVSVLAALDQALVETARSAPLSCSDGAAEATELN